jgi:penicillin-binding protein 2
VNAYGRVIAKLSAKPSAAGKDVYLTLDCQLQRYAEERLGDESAACVVMDTATGDVLALASTPGYDPNLFNVGISNTAWNELLHNDHKPLVNKALSGAYPPGSTFKPAMALAALRQRSRRSSGQLHRRRDPRQPYVPLLAEEGSRPRRPAPRHSGVLRRVLL